MLKSLTVTNFALIEQAQVEFAAGLNILTGETGAGKSILIDAVNAILGGRASAEAIRSGCDHFRVEGVFDISGDEKTAALLSKQGLMPEADEDLIISRRFSRQGKNTILINGCHVTVSVLRQIGAQLADMHGQHENQALLRPEAYLEILDNAADTAALLYDYRNLYQSWQETQRELSQLEKNAQQWAQRHDMLTWQTQEIAAVKLKAGEEEELTQKISVLSNSEKIATAVNRAYLLLDQGTGGLRGVLPALSEVKRELEVACRYEVKLQNHLAAVTDAIYQLEDSCMELRTYGEEFEFNPQLLSRLQERMDSIYKLKKKYGSTAEEVLAYYETAVAELSAMNNYDQQMAELIRQREEIKGKLSQAASRLDSMRRKAAGTVSRQVSIHLADLGMKNARFLIEVTSVEHFTPDGSNEAAFLFSANPGEEAKPLYKVASGGELSRIALALKTVMASQEGVGVMIFDEIDAGIGGQAGHMVAEKVAMVATARQVLCITHLPQIACMADRHISIKKQVEGERTHTVLETLTPQEQLLELTRMISGTEITEISLQNAAQMRQTALQKKEKWQK